MAPYGVNMFNILKEVVIYDDGDRIGRIVHVDKLPERPPTPKPKIKVKRKIWHKTNTI